MRLLLLRRRTSALKHFAILSLALGICSYGQSSPSQRWYVDVNHALYWEGKPYVPVGVHIPGDLEHVKALVASGLKDAIVDLPLNRAAWIQVLPLLEKAQVRYLIQISSLGSMAEGITVDPAGYRIEIAEPQDIELKIPGAQKVLVVVAEKQSQEIRHFEVLETPDGLVKTRLAAQSGLDQVALFYPIGKTLQLPDVWEQFDRDRDKTLALCKEFAGSPGWRGLINPMGSMSLLSGSGLRVVPRSHLFQLNFSTYLQEKYSTMPTLAKAWNLTANSVESFQEIAKYVPLWSGSRGLGYIWNPDSGEKILCDAPKSQIWTDIREAVNLESTKRLTRFVGAIRNTADIPVIQDWGGDSPLYEGISPLDGIGICTVSEGLSQTLDLAGPGISTTYRLKNSCWSLATSIAPSAYSSMRGAINDLSDAGVQGFFVNGSDLSVWEDVIKLASDTSSQPNPLPSPLYFPIGCRNPAHCIPLPGKQFWLPSPQSGQRLNLGSRYSAYILGERSMVIWSNAGNFETTLLAPESDTQTYFVTSVDGLNKKPRKVKEGLKLVIGELPVKIDGISDALIPADAIEELKSRVSALEGYAEKKGVPTSDEMYGYEDAVKAIGRNPLRSYDQLLQIYARLAAKAGRSTWIEAELSKSHTFSEAQALNGCSGGNALRAFSGFDLVHKKMTADFTLVPKGDFDQTLWVAAKLPEGQAGTLKILLNGDTVTVEGKPVGHYGQGFAWYRVASVRLSGATTKLRLICSPPLGTEVLVDALLLTPEIWAPNGLNRPDPIPFLATPAPVKKKSKG